MTTPRGLERKVRKLDEDFQAMHHVLTEIQAVQQRHGHRLNAIETTLADHTGTLADHTGTLADHTAKLDAIHAKLGEHDAKFDAIQVKLGEHDGKFDLILELLRGRRP